MMNGCNILAGSRIELDIAEQSSGPAFPKPELAAVFKDAIVIPSLPENVKEQLNRIKPELHSPFSSYILRYGLEAVAHRIMAECALTSIQNGISGTQFEQELSLAFKLQKDKIEGPVAALESFGLFIPEAAYQELKRSSADCRPSDY